MHKGRVFTDLCSAELIEHALLNREGKLADTGALVTLTGDRTGRSPSDRFIVKDSSTLETIDWGDVNRPFEGSTFNELWNRVDAFLRERDRLISHLHVGQNSNHYLPISITTQTAWHALFARNMFIRSEEFNPEGLPCWQILHASGFQCDSRRDGVNSEGSLVIDFESRRVLIAGLQYAGEIKKAMFSVQNYILPGNEIMPMHCAANVGEDGDTALFFGLSGTGKTTLSADSDRYLIGDDEHAWTDGCVFNLEGGCYAKTIDLTSESEPDIYATTQKFATVIENMVYDDETKELDFKDSSLTPNMRCSYPLNYISNASETGLGGYPKNIIMLTCDAFGVLPPISKLTPAQAMYHFLSGFTSKIAGTERGVTEPEPTFSTCFGAPFMPLRPEVYGKLLQVKIANHGSHCWLLNTGWTGGGYGFGSRMPIKATRALLTAALDGSLLDAPFRKDPNFSFEVPMLAQGVDSGLLDPRSTWADQEAYDQQAQKLVNMFSDNFAKFVPFIDDDVRAASIS
ncbi:MAG: phosphoenolpyruvate carboxykinase (ATP) [Cellvibrionales bacterium TMED148]|nr:phosphoenolpyruvate carboxykinase (ATP) [Porticoccaceae bacterium]RPG90121.1 MAG: phosphoenolpyruvate carboxykinase (ATP) [Cellvibrionales bacterium TMED148]